MADIINLRRVKKQKARTEAAQKADANRLKFGQSKATRSLTEALEKQDAAKLDAHKRETE